MIRKSTRLFEAHQDLIQTLDYGHKDCLNLVAKLRDPSCEVWTKEPPRDPPATRFNATGWVYHFSHARQRLASLRADVGADVVRVYPRVELPLNEYLADIPEIVADIQRAIDRHAGRAEPLTTAERTALANAIEARLEA